MGRIVYWGLIRTVITILLLWISYDYYYNKYWWIIAGIVIYLIIIHPILNQYKAFTRKNETVINDSLCSKCKHFDETAVLCMKYDKHPTEDYIPCDGTDWEPK